MTKETELFIHMVHSREEAEKSFADDLPGVQLILLEQIKGSTWRAIAGTSRDEIDTLLGDKLL